MQNGINNLDYLIQQAAQRGLDIILNPSPCDQDLLGCSLSQVRWLVLNEVEGEQITGEQESRAILQALAAHFPQPRGGRKVSGRADIAGFGLTPRRGTKSAI